MHIYFAHDSVIGVGLGGNSSSLLYSALTREAQKRAPEIIQRLSHYMSGS